MTGHPIPDAELPPDVTGNFTFVCVTCGDTVTVVDTVQQPHVCRVVIP